MTSTAICSRCHKSVEGNCKYVCQRCRSESYCNENCARKDKLRHMKDCDIMKSGKTWYCLEERSINQDYVNPHYPYTLWSPDKSNWNEIMYPTNDEIKDYMDKIGYSSRNKAILSTYNITNFSNVIYEIIINYLPLFQYDERIEFLDEYQDNKYNLSLNGYFEGFTEYHNVIKKRMDWGTGIINRFLMSTNLITKQDAISTNMNIGIRQRLSTWIHIVYWYRMGMQIIWKRGKKPADILGILNNGKYFYYKHGHPNDFGQYGITHDKYFYLIANDIQSLFKQMDKRDIELFLQHKKEWKPIEKCRSNIQFHLIHVKEYDGVNKIL